MTLQERKKLAKAARELASLYAEGAGPELRTFSWCGCAAGQIFKRAGIGNTEEGSEAAHLDFVLDCILTGATARHNGEGGHDRIPGAVVFPLLWAADELESAP